MTPPSTSKSTSKGSRQKSVESEVPQVPARTSRRRGRRHPGVVLLKPDPVRRIGWRARYADPDTGRTTKETLDASLTTTEARADWAVRKSKALAKRRLELESGAPRTTGTSLEHAIGRYFEDHPHLSTRTQQIYKAGAGKLLAWAKRIRLESADDLDGSKLVAFRATLVKETRQVHVEGGKRGELKATDERRAPATVNAELRAIGTVLTYLRRLGLLPRLSSDALSDGLQKLKAPPKRIHYLKPHELQQLLNAALRHDAETFKATREEHAARTAGSTPRYTPIAPIVAAALMTGMRFQALIDLDWKHVDLDALNHEGRKVGEIVPPAGSVTKRTGVIGLEVSPALRHMLAAMRPKDAAGSVFGLTREEAKASLRRVVAEYDAPSGSTWQTFRRTCGTYLTNAPGIFGAASAYRSAKQLGHSVQVAERHYVGVVGVAPTARTLEAAMQIEPEMQRVLDAVGTHGSKSKRK